MVPASITGEFTSAASLAAHDDPAGPEAISKRDCGVASGPDCGADHGFRSPSVEYSRTSAESSKVPADLT